jgi:signal transduction histidine kinase
MYFNNDTFDSLIVKKHLDFLSKYEDQIKPRFRARLYLNLGELFIAGNEIEKSMACFRKNNFKPTDYYSAYYIAKSQNSLVYDFITIGQIDSAIVYAQKALPFFEKYDDKYAQATVYGDLQAAHRSMGNFQEAEKYALQAIKLHTALQNSADIFDALYNLYILRDEKKQKTSQSDSLSASEDAVINFEKQWKSSKPRHKLAAQTILAARYFRDSNYVETGRILDRITPLFALVDSRYHSESFVTLLGQYESALHKPLSLRKYYVERLQEAENDHELNLVQTYNWLLSQEAKGLNDYKKAYEYSLASNEAANKRNIEKIRDDASELDKKYQTEKKEAQIKQQTEDATKKNIFIAFLGLGLAALLYFYNTLKKQKNIITQQNELNEQTISILSHDIKEPLLGVKLLLKKLNKDDAFVAQASQSLENQINSVNGILNNLLKMKKLSFSKKDVNAKANVNTVIKNVVQELSVAIQSKELIINNEIKEDFTVPISQEKLQIIVNNLLSNAVKYSFPNQSIRIFQEGNGFSIQDFGVGLSPEQRSKIMREVTASQQGTKQERGNGLGLFLVGALLQGEQLKVIFDSPEIGGTIAKIWS